ncbi:MAG: hypothetical protein MJ143_02615 [Clostridia bacterium]|nr:hypothetical protein [Clostridia bacterium]
MSNYTKRIFEIFALNFDDVDDECYDSLLDEMESIISNGQWKEIFEDIKNYLFTNCNDAESTLNFVNWFYAFGFQNQEIDKPIAFLGYLYYRFDLKPTEYDAADVLDSIAFPILEKITGKQLRQNYSYSPEREPIIINSVKEWRNKDVSK